MGTFWACGLQSQRSFLRAHWGGGKWGEGGELGCSYRFPEKVHPQLQPPKSMAEGKSSFLVSLWRMLFSAIGSSPVLLVMDRATSENSPCCFLFSWNYNYTYSTLLCPYILCLSSSESFLLWKVPRLSLRLFVLGLSVLTPKSIVFYHEPGQGSVGYDLGKSDLAKNKFPISLPNIWTRTPRNQLDLKSWWFLECHFQVRWNLWD